MKRMRVKVEPGRMEKLLARSGWGAAFEEDDLRSVAERFWLETAPEGEALFEQGDRDAYMGIIVDGAVDISRRDGGGADRLITTLGDGAVFGEMSVLDGQSRSASARVRKDLTMVVLTAEDFGRLVVERPRLGLTLVRAVSRLVSLRLRQMDNLLEEYFG
ncbi:Crp/Fnr family transcriptional regulator [Salidesulfovibrio onnuriiensis]|uniref:Crp/Fnr family transcriptional regulator n=1 Tax=Salidesulfovibrio onnuriiensis TaxID=2583823 RepID=UPI0011CB95F1|nr:cyclic nucleotide-binding domain-containing protein [Salidesulfovibrio onnuriiensis]